MDAFTDGVERTVDLGRVNDRAFVNNTSLGVYAEVVRLGMGTAVDGQRA